jgi:hypothetical protein
MILANCQLVFRHVCRSSRIWTTEALSFVGIAKRQPPKLPRELDVDEAIANRQVNVALAGRAVGCAETPASPDFHPSGVHP